MLIFDLESDGLLDELTRIHTLHIIDTDTGEALRFNEGSFADGTPAPRDGSLEDGVNMLQDADELCGHNIIFFDIPAITKIFPWFSPTGRVRDTLLYTRLIWPHIKDIDMAAMKKGKRPEGFGKLIGTHKLEAWGYRLGVLKGQYTGGWEDFTQDMEDYAAQDVVVTRALWEKIAEKEYPEEAAALEHAVQRVIFMQERFGFQFDDAGAERLEIELRGRKAELEDELRSTFQPWYEPERKHGKHVVMTPKRGDRRRHYTKGAPFSKVKLVSFNPASRPQIADRLHTLFGWTPVEFTDSGAPKVDETTLDGLDYPEARLLVDYLTVEKRLGQLADGKQAWRKAVRDDGRVHGRVNTLGAVTRRMTHSTPNMAQVPSTVNAKGAVPYGKECRALFTVSKDNLLCGCDAEGLELRMLAHYMARHDGGTYGEAVVNGSKEDGTDVHTLNQKLIVLNSRNSAKTWIYAYLYGAGLLKLGTVIYEDYTPEQRSKFNAKHPPGKDREKAIARLGLKARKRVETGLPALGKLQENVKRLAARKYLKTIDGGRLRVRSAHAALNTLLQGGGAVVMKKALVILYDDLVEQGFVPDLLSGEFRRDGDVIGFTANVHDEFQAEVPKHLADWFGERAALSIKRAGESFDMRCPLSGAFETGRNWAETH